MTPNYKVGLFGRGGVGKTATVIQFCSSNNHSLKFDQIKSFYSSIKAILSKFMIQQVFNFFHYKVSLSKKKNLVEDSYTRFDNIPKIK